MILQNSLPRKTYGTLQRKSRRNNPRPRLSEGYIGSAHSWKRSTSSRAPLRSSYRPNQTSWRSYGYGSALPYWPEALVTCVQGPVKFLLQVTSALSSAFDKLVKVLAEIGAVLPLFNDYASLFKDNQTVKHVLRLFYTEILEFYKILLDFVNDRSKLKPIAWVEAVLIMWLARTENSPGAILAQRPLKDICC